MTNVTTICWTVHNFVDKKAATQMIYLMLQHAGVKSPDLILMIFPKSICNDQIKYFYAFHDHGWIFFRMPQGGGG